MSEVPQALLQQWPRLDVLGWRVEKLDSVDRSEEAFRNRVYFLRYGSKRYVVRVPGVKPGQVQRPKESYVLEMHNLAAAASAGVTPSPILADPSDGFLVLPFIEGSHPVRREVSSKSAGRIARCLRALHDETEPFGQGTDFLRRITSRVSRVLSNPQAARSHSESLPDTARLLEPILTDLDRTSPSPVSCHGDLVLANIIDDGSRVYLIDWETSTLGDPHQDLGTFLLRARLSDEAREAFVSAYFEGESGERRDWACARVKLWEAARALDKALIYWNNGCRTGKIDRRVDGWTRRCAGLLEDPETKHALRVLR